MKEGSTKANLENKERMISRRSLLKMAGTAGFMAAFPNLLVRKSYAAVLNQKGISSKILEGNYPDWLAEARLYGLPIKGLKVDSGRMKVDLDRALEQGANVIEAESRLSDYLNDEDFGVELNFVGESVKHIHARGLKVVWNIPALRVVTPNGRLRKDTVAQKHPDWLQLSFDRKRRGLLFNDNDEVAWMCPNSPYQGWFMGRLRELAKTGIDGLWLDVPLFSPTAGKWGCANNYCRQRFTKQTGVDFPREIDVSDKRFRRFIRWRHETLTAFIERCQKVLQLENPDAAAIAVVSSLDHLGAVEWGTEGSSMANNFVVWKQDGISEATAMADAEYDDWMAQYSSYKYARGATMDRPSWAFCYGYNEADAQLVMAGAVATQNNPYELRTPKMTTTVGRDFRGMMYAWIAKHSKQIFRSRSLSPVAVLHSERNRDFLDALHTGGMVLADSGPTRGRRWLGNKESSPLNLEYMGDYRGLTIFLHQHQIPTDIYPVSRVNADLLGQYKVLLIPSMASVSDSEKEMLLRAVRKGSSLIITGNNPGMWDGDGNRLKRSQWADLLGNGKEERMSVRVGKGSVHFWKDLVGRHYLRTHDERIAARLLPWLEEAGVKPWINKVRPVVIQPYVYQDQVIIHVLNYSWIGSIENQPERLSLNLSIPWNDQQGIEDILQSEPQWNRTRSLSFKKRRSLNGSQLVIPFEVGIHSLVIINSA